MVANWYGVAKALHLVGVVSWMAGIFYLVRIMVYHAMALQRVAAERAILAPQLAEMQWKAYRIIIKPAVVITWLFGAVMLWIQPAWLMQVWMQVKLALLVLFSWYTYYCQSHIRRLEAGDTRFTHVYYRALNEVPTLIMVAVIFLAVFKSGINWWILSIGIVLFSALIFSAVRKINKKG